MKNLLIFVRANLWIVPLLLLLVWLMRPWLDPAPPRTLVISTGPESGAYHDFARRLQVRLAADGFDLQLRPSRGSGENLHRLLESETDVQLALLQTGMATSLQPRERDQLYGLAALYQEPLWLFARSAAESAPLEQLKDWRLSVGAEGSGTRAVLEAIYAQLPVNPIQPLLQSGFWQSLNARESASALLAGELDAAFMVLPAEHPLIMQLLSDPAIRLLSLQQSEALAARLRFLQLVELPRGLLDLHTDQPAQPIRLLAPAATLVANQQFHPALTSLLLEHSRELLAEGSLLAAPGSFPAAQPMDLPLSRESEYYHRNGLPLLQRWLPFWLASLFDRYLLLLIPFIAVLLPLLRSMGPVYRWRVRARVYRWYAQLREVDRQILDGGIRQTLAAQLQAMLTLEDELARVDVPLSYAHELYSLHLHVRYMINRLRELQAQTTETST